jgi:hypothetical protein
MFGSGEHRPKFASGHSATRTCPKLIYFKNKEMRAATGRRRDKKMAAILERMRCGTMPAAAEIRAKSVGFLNLTWCHARGSPFYPGFFPAAVIARKLVKP